ncbi:hypothetical protein ACR79T_01755 [Sphingobacterium spiritivorum]|uniref:hypothetical protein n=1 Tax=Sphingobacterium spiritivorum TaxID=258 RepID=UPI003DA1EE34
MDLEQLLKNQAGGDGQKEQKSPLDSLKVDLDFYAESIKEVAAEMLSEGYTLFPIFVAHQHQVSVGEVILDKTDLDTKWSINASSLEEFVERGLIKEDRKAYFERTYKKPEDYMCLFVIVPEGANFVFYPYK